MEVTRSAPATSQHIDTETAAEQQTASAARRSGSRSPTRESLPGLDSLSGSGKKVASSNLFGSKGSSSLPAPATEPAPRKHGSYKGGVSTAALATHLQNAFTNISQLDAKMDEMVAKGKFTVTEADTVIKSQMQTWLKKPGTEAALHTQATQSFTHKIGKEDLFPGCILVRKESIPESKAHAFSLGLQMVPDLNGIENNQGDDNCFHIMMWAHDQHNPVKTELDGKGEAEQLEARGGLGTSNTMRVQASSIQEGQYWVYKPTDRNVGDWAAQAGQMWQDVPYSKTILGTSMKPGDKFTKFTDAAQKDILRVASDPFTHAPPQAQPSDGVHFLSMTPKERTPGEICSSVAVRLYQAAHAQIALANQVEKNQELPTDDEAEAMLEKIVSEFTGLMANNAEGVSPKSVEHFCKVGKTAEGEPQFNFLGVLTVDAKDVLYPEARYDSENNRIPAAPR
ncbi:hypothetical protein [Collimonas fungivorans]|uniref:Uncharacterized protein n=1 Tax=Collimonas fungivorans (strain Ter331) TaxID=1005048 RepID=G0AEG9_COLFT|nr:hypothetical protein [Collimonas fungivorans]AEK64177.1 hypothetical protein CFU_4356 [Collimonas fungivorans Ter331]